MPASRDAEFAEALPAGLTEEQALQVCTTLAGRPRGLLLDVDGTLSQLVTVSAEARLLPGIAEELERAPVYFDTLAAISGRSAAQARQIVGAPHLLYFGNHGLDCWLPDAPAPVTAPEAIPYLPVIAQAMDLAEEELTPRLPGVFIERKGATGTVNTRGCAHPQQALKTALQALRPLAERLGLRLTQGKMIAELRPPIALDKGAAIEHIVREYKLASAIYLGDDTTDLDAFRALHRLQQAGVCAGLAVVVLHDDTPHALLAEADCSLPSIEAVPTFLHWLLEMLQARL